MNSELLAIVTSGGAIELEWTSLSQKKVDKDKQKLQREVFQRFQKNVASTLIFLGFCDEKVTLSPSLEFWKSFGKIFVKKLIQTPDLEKIRDNIKLVLLKQEMDDLFSNLPFTVGAEYLDSDLLLFLWSRLNKQIQKEIKEYEGTVENLLKSYQPDIHLLGRIYFHLVENKNSEEFPFAFLATYSTNVANENESKHLPLKFALQEYADNNTQMLELLTTIELAAQSSDLIADLLESGEIFHPLAWKPGEAFTFLQEIVIYEQAGILCRIPDWWKGQTAGVKIDIKVGEKPPQYMGMESLLQFDASLLLDGEVITEEEVQKILEESRGLAYIKGKWTEVNPEKLEQVLAAFKKAQKAIKSDNLSVKEAIQIQLGTKKFMGISAAEDLLSVSNGDWLQSTIAKLKDPDSIKSIRPGKNFKAKLRTYQQDGLNWLNFLYSLQFGACLADDMGLGKTIQVIAFMNSLKSRGNKIAHLLVVPASLLSNWQKEIDRFAPSLKYFIAHSSYHPNIQKIDKNSKFLNTYDVVITTYALAQRYEWLQSHQWKYIVLDEAQAIKNPGTKQTKAVKKLKCDNRIALTGTPIENKIGDLWSLYDFLNPGLLGSVSEFNKFTKNLKNEGYARLKQVISPYLLRRLKTDKTIIDDLPDKIEMKVYSSLSKKQIILYQQLVKSLQKSLEDTTGIQRRGLILSSLMKFKQICNHPGQYLGNGEFLEKDSGKFSQLNEICQTILSKREKVLIFTQFKEITAALHDFLKTIFDRDGLILHGGISVKKRKGLIERFQSDEYVPFFILSVKAGGVGLNLTQANHVIHFDRWWNPAVENQATDRVFRIGQKKKVLVHKFITKGTIEEKIDAMLEDKLSLSQEIIESSGENWITKMDNQEILNMFQLRK